MPCFDMPDGLWDFPQAVTPVDDGLDWSCLHQLAKKGQILFGDFGPNHDELLAYDPRHDHRPEQTSQKANHPPAATICGDRKSTRLNSSHVSISYAVFCLKKKKKSQHLEI